VLDYSDDDISIDKFMSLVKSGEFFKLV